jgi:hypothetical protein
MRLLPKRLTAWRRRGHAGVASDLAFLSPEERKELAGLKRDHGTLSRDGSRLGSDSKLGPGSFRRPR